jgi:hypothetical protein
MTITVMRFTAACSLLIGFAGLMMVTMPTEQLPSLEWRVHFGLAESAFGILIGISAGRLFGSYLYGPRS